MRISLIQMNMKQAAPEENYPHAVRLIETTIEQEHPDVLVLPETWNTGFFPKENLSLLADDDGARTIEEIGALAKQYAVNIVAGSVANRRNDSIYNTAYIFDREGNVIASYDKTHLFSPMGEHEFFEAGDHLCRFELDGVSCAMIICYDIRFPELTKCLTLGGVDILFVTVCNSCGSYDDTQYGGGSVLIDPWGKVLTEAGTEEEIITGDLDLSVVEGIRSSINVFRDRRADLY